MYNREEAIAYLFSRRKLQKQLWEQQKRTYKLKAKSKLSM
jgi:hypothetical protein